MSIYVNGIREAYSTMPYVPRTAVSGNISLGSVGGMLATNAIYDEVRFRL